ncbi:MAG: hypothetical protein SGILL_000518 [Bacillariaceae sp.]
MTEEKKFKTTLFRAALAGDAASLESTINDYVEKHGKTSPTHVLSEVRDGKKRCCLHLVCQSKRKMDGDSTTEDVLEKVLNKKEWFPDDDVLRNALTQKDVNGITPLMLACQLADQQMAQRRVRFLLSKCPSLGKAQSRAGATALHYAAAAGANSETIKVLHESAKMAINHFANKGGTPLHWAVVAKLQADGSQEQEDALSSTLEGILECGADVNAHQWTENKQGTKEYSTPPPLLLAIDNQYLFNRLLQCQDIALGMIAPNGDNLLHFLATFDLSIPLQSLLEKMDSNMNEKKAALGMKNAEGFTPLEMAVKKGNAKCVRLLLAATHGSNPSEQEAQAYIMDKWNASQPPPAQTQQPTQSPQPSVTTGAFEVEVQQRAAALLDGPDVTAEEHQHALDLKSQGNKFFANKQWDAAVALYTQAADANPKEATFYTNRSACLMNLGRVEDSLADALVARTLKPDWSKACYRVAVAHLSLNRYEDAATEAFNGLEIDPDNKELKKLLEKCVLKAREEEQARRQQHAAAENPNDPRVVDKLIRRRYKELRSQGKSTEEAMQQAREELQPSDIHEVDAGAQVAAMFGIF